MFGQFVYGQENLDLNELLTTSQMPTDAEIMQVVDKYNFTSEEKEQLFSETKKLIVELYRTQDLQSLQQRALQGKQTLDNMGLSVQDLMAPLQ
jgi:hypothetical protein